jgi:PAT family beta-lactamase induction signal transducer AmpG
MSPQPKALRYSLFGLLYFTQGTVLGYFAALNALYLLSNGLDMADVGVFSSIALIPFVIKILFGILSDRVHAKVVRWLKGGQWIEGKRNSNVH